MNSINVWISFAGDECRDLRKEEFLTYARLRASHRRAGASTEHRLLRELSNKHAILHTQHTSVLNYGLSGFGFTQGITLCRCIIRDILFSHIFWIDGLFIQAETSPTAICRTLAQ